MITMTAMTMSITVPPAAPPAIAPVVLDDAVSLPPPNPFVPDPAGWEEWSWVSACVSGVDGELVVETAVGTCGGVTTISMRCTVIIDSSYVILCPQLLIRQGSKGI